jgi:hypothetical protein
LDYESKAKRVVLFHHEPLPSPPEPKPLAHAPAARQASPGRELVAMPRARFTDLQMGMVMRAARTRSVAPIAANF